tara:strand:+ start:170 stop:367 length:198 start_codon:yes stop_codon:yes gene_type:complete
MDIVLTLMIVLNLANPETREFINTAVDNNKKYDCRFVYKGISAPKNKPAIDLFGYTLFRQECKNK